MSDVWWPEGTDNPAFQVQRTPFGQIVGGDYVRARSGGITTLPQTALRYTTQVKGWDALQDKALMAVRPSDYSTMEILWGWPNNLGNEWLEVSLVRSAFGIPVTVNDGVTVFRATRDAMLVTFSPDGEGINGPIIYDRPLNGGFWYYYAVFFKTTPLDWVKGFSASNPLPKNYGHAEHLWNHLPPWYQYTDNQQRADDGHLRQFLQVFGFELDLTREYVEQWQQLYHIDFCPMRLLRRLGENFNVPYESGLGDIRYRGLVGNIAKLYAERGTSAGLDHLIEAASQYQCSTTTGDNIMLTPEDSEFLTGTGRWAAFHPALERTEVPLIAGDHNSPDQTVLTVADTSVTPPPPTHGRGVMEFHAEGDGFLENLAICCGCGIKTLPGPPDENGDYPPVETEILPIYGGIAVARPGILYGFSVWIKEDDPQATTVGIMWFGPNGQVEDLLGYDEQIAAAPTEPATDWKHYTIQAAAPLADDLADPPVPRATYLVPYIRVEGTYYTASVYVAGAVVYEPAKGATNVVPFAPDRYLTLGDPSEMLGTDPEPPTGQGGGLLLGQPGG